MPRKSNRLIAAKTTILAVPNNLIPFVVAPPAALPTYGEVYSALQHRLTPKSFRRVSNAYSKWRRIFGRSPSDTAVELVSEAFDDSLSVFSQHLAKAGFKLGTIANICVGARALANGYTRLSSPVTPLVQTNGYYRLIEAGIVSAGLKGEDAQYLRRSIKAGRMPKSAERVAEIAKLIGVDVDLLTPHVWLPETPLLFDLCNPDYTWNVGHFERTQSAYALTGLPPNVANAIKPFLDWRSGRLPGRINFMLLDGSIREVKRSSVWTLRESQARTERSATEGIVLEFLNCFFGFCTLPRDAEDPMLRGLGIAENDLRLSHIFVGANVAAYCDFQKVRNGSFDHYGLGKVRQDYGLLIGSQDAWGRYAQALLADDLRAVIGTDCPSTPSSWTEWCDGQVAVLDDWIETETEGRKGKAKYRRARCAEEALAELLNRERPMAEVVWPTIYWLIDNQPPSHYSLYTRMRFYQKIFTITALTTEPHRIENWQGMRWAKNLFKRDNSTWHLNIPANEFKNRRLLTGPYRSNIETAAQRMFETYYELWKECFGYDPLDPANVKRLSYVLAPYPGVEPKKPCHGIVREHLIILSDLWGITVGPHAFRHIWATDYLKRFPDDFTTVAGRLNEKVSTVMSAYAHLNSMDHARRIERANAGLESIARGHLKSTLRKKLPLQ